MIESVKYFLKMHQRSNVYFMYTDVLLNISNDIIITITTAIGKKIINIY